MLRRRIFSAAMASVMALSSVAVVAQAEETTNKVVTEAELKELITVTYGDAWRADELKNYGPTTTERVYDALEAADTILNDPDSDEEDWTVAYQMVEAVMDTLYNYTLEELKDLVKEAEKIINKYPNNIFNEELQDQVYTSASFSNLEAELDEAKGFLTSTSPADITSAYEELKAAIDGLVENPKVTKSDFRTVLKAYNEIIDNKYDYDAWRRGTANWFAYEKISTGNAWVLHNQAASVAYGHLYNIVAAAEDGIVEAYDTIDAIKGLTVTTDAEIYEGYVLAKDAIMLYNAWSADSVNKSTKAGLAQLIDEYHGQLVYDYATTEMDTLFADIKYAISKYDVDASVVTMGTDAAAGSTATDDLWNTVVIKEHYWGDNEVPGTDKLIEASAFIKLATLTGDKDTDKKILKVMYIPVNDAGYYDTDASRTGIVFEREQKDNGKYQTISVGSKFDISKLIDITKDVVGDDMTSAENNTADDSDETGYSWAWLLSSGDPLTSTDPAMDAWDYSVSLEKAMKIAEIYLYEDKDTIKDPKVNPIKDIDTKNTIAVKDEGNTIVLTGQAPEYQMAYRYLYYALTEKYEGAIATSDCPHTKADVKKLINDAWDLIEETGDAAIFNEANVKLAEARQDAMNWVAAADSDRLYKEYTKGVSPMDKNGDKAYDTYDSSTDAYHALEKVYGNLLDEYNALKYSFGEIYEEIYKVAQKIDNGDLELTKELEDAMHATALALSDIDPITYTLEMDGDEHYEYEDNYAFDDLRYFQPINRVITTDAEKGVSIDTIAAELKIGTASVTTAGGLNPTHAALASAYAALIAAQDQKADKGILGDVNGDTKVTPADAAMILKKYVGLEVEGYNADVADFNEDGKVTPADAADILKAYVS